MNQTVRHYDQPEVLGLENGLEAFQSSPAFRGPVEPLDEHTCNDHFAHIYETREEKFEAAIPFIRHGLECGERVMYIIEESTEAEVREAMCDAGLDVDAALATGALTFHTVQETYLRNGSFDPDEMIDFYGEMVTEATEDYEALRIVAEMTWLDDDDTSVERFIEYEQKINDLFEHTDSLAICQYNRDLFEPEVIRNVVQTHPHLIYDGAACHNIYYTPPEEFFGADAPARENERMLRTLRDRTTAKAQLHRRERFLQNLYEVSSDPTLSFEEKLQALFDLGCEQFDLELGAMAKVDPDADQFEVEFVSDDHEYFEAGLELPLSETYCTAATDTDGVGSVSDPVEAGYDDTYVHDEFGIKTYFGTYIEVEGDDNRTFFFVSEKPRDEDFSANERTFQRLLGQWVKYELERQQRERFLHECYEITSDPALDFEEKLERLLELGCDRFGLEIAGLNHLPSWDGKFRLEKGIGLGVDSDAELWTDPDNGCYCRQTMVEDSPVGTVDVRDTRWAEDTIYQEFGLTSYLGTNVSTGAAPYGTLWFGSTEPRDRPFSETERSFIELMGQWVSYEIEQRENNDSQRKLYEITANPDLDPDEKIDQLLEVGCKRLNLPIGMLTHKRERAFEIEHMHGSHPELDEGTLTPPLTDNYCRRVVNTGNSISVGDAGEAGWDGDALYTEFNLKCYAGTQVFIRGENYGTVCFTDMGPREEFTEAEQVFLDILGQCVSYELERQQHEADLKETIDQLEQSNDRLKQFAYAASHDLQEPLRMVSTYLQLLENRYKADLDEDAREFIDFAVNGADRMRKMVDDLLAFSRVEHTGDEFDSVDCDAVLDHAIDDLQIQIEEKEAEIISESLPTVRGDQEQLEHLFRNLVSNATKYNESDRPRVEISADQRSNRWKFSVTDNGIGIDPDGADKIFDVFKRLHHDDEYSGTGVGLSLCQKIANNHGGEIWVESEPGAGSTFSFTLPAVENSTQ
ncbi:MEDS domain-containing protein [Natrialba asiatica]|uniref:histidine kinase n=1 Tax=Natrialba asiatica (strain ATCC 700177 / DSM 12278 / JCM 9576 / FERM P-10747 / NBRC 102637 / 172P1) TaxID=29540 RepID=M0AU05_NATA1|nr:MEDS domain-containing protein [Natrialba asiatica]ELZ02010.1 GAF sensor signal transduction histidine kinase [Natrialba asiatica DSM 12278]